MSVTCSICGGPASPSAVPGSDGVLTHDRREDWIGTPHEVSVEHTAHVELCSGLGLYYVWCGVDDCDLMLGYSNTENEAYDWAKHHERDPKFGVGR